VPGFCRRRTLTSEHRPAVACGKLQLCWIGFHPR